MKLIQWFYDGILYYSNEHRIDLVIKDTLTIALFCFTFHKLRVIDDSHIWAGDNSD